MKMSKELAASLEASANKRKAKRSLDVTKRQVVLDKLGARILRKADGRKPLAQFNPVIPAEQCGVNGLRPTWHGRAS